MIPSPARLAHRLGTLVGAGATPAEAAELEHVSLDELVALRIDHWQEYDAGLEQTRGKPQLERWLNLQWFWWRWESRRAVLEGE